MQIAKEKLKLILEFELLVNLFGYFLFMGVKL